MGGTRMPATLDGGDLMNQSRARIRSFNLKLDALAGALGGIAGIFIWSIGPHDKGA